MNSTTQNFINTFGGRVWLTMPDGWPIYTHAGRDRRLEGDYEPLMVDSLEQGKNLLINAFPVVDLYPDPNAVY